MSGNTDSADRAVQVLRWLLDERDHDAFLASLADDAVWKTPGDWDGISGVNDKAMITYFLKGMRLTFPDGFSSDIHRVMSDESGATVEFRGAGRTARGNDYANNYCMVLEFDGEKVIEIREYMDTLVADRNIFSVGEG